MTILLFLTALLISNFPSGLPAAESAKSEIAALTHNKPYKFTSDYFSLNARKWPELLKELKGKPDLRYLEIGVLEGRSFFWILENILSHPLSRATAVDLFDGPYYETFKNNVKLSGVKNKIEIIKAPSSDALRKLPPESFDLVYVDGSHQGKDVFLDAALAWGSLKYGGILIFDDYAIDVTFPPEATPNFTVNAFMTVFRGSYRLLDRDYQVVIKKILSPCERYQNCVVIGSYAYLFHEKKIRSKDLAVELTSTESATIEALIKQRLDSDSGPSLFDKIRKTEAWKAISARAKL